LANTGLPASFLALVEAGEIGVGHIDLAADLEDAAVARTGEPGGHVIEGAQVGGHVFALHAITARCALHEAAVLVSQRHRQPVDLGLGGKHHFSFWIEPQEAADLLDEAFDVVAPKGVVERQHRHLVAHLGELFRRRRADPPGRRIGPHEFGKARLDGPVALAQAHRTRHP
jgi:hypothetical protein